MRALNKLVEKLAPESRQVVYGTFHALYGRRDGSPFAWFCPAHTPAEARAETETDGHAKSLADAKAGAERHARSHTRFVTIHLED